MPTTKNPKLNNAIKDLENASFGYGKSGKYQRMERKLNELSECINRYYEKSGDNYPVLGSKDIEEIKKIYGDALRLCEQYTSGKGTSRHSGYGTARLQSVLAIEKILRNDILELQNIQSYDKVTLPKIIENARITEVTLETETKDLEVVGALSSTRIPIEVSTEAGNYQGFFTEDYTVLSDENLFNYLKGAYAGKSDGLKAIFDSFVDKDGDIKKGKIQSLANDLHFIRGSLDNKKNGGEKPELSADDEVNFKRYYEGYIKILYGPDYQETFGKINKDADSRQAFIDFIEDASGLGRERYINKNIENIPFDENIPNRNVGVSRIAEILGVQDVVAKAERVTITDKDGVKRTGVFQETARGRDSRNLRYNDPLYEISKHPGLLNDPKIKMQISDMQVLDFICGNTDRHDGNIIYDMKKIDGEWKLAGIKGIDNDRTFGVTNTESLSKRTKGYFTLPNDMKVIRKATAESVSKLSKEQLSIILKDLNFSEEVINSCWERTVEMQNCINNKRIAVIEDEEFKALNNNYDFLRSNAETMGSRENHFERIADLEKLDSIKPDLNKKTVKYNRGSASLKIGVQNDEEPIYVKDLAAQYNKLKNIHEDLHNNKKTGHINRGGFKWMNNSLKATMAKLKQLNETYKEKSTLSKVDAADLDALYRQLRNASAEYAKTHADAKSPMGVNRKDWAIEMSKYTAPRYPKPSGFVKSLSFDEANSIINTNENTINTSRKRPVHKPTRINKHTIEQLNKNFHK